MAQLRDKQTSAFLAEGTPLQMATLAQTLGFDEVIFDDVGAAFDPETVLASHVEAVENLPDDAPDEFKEQVAGADKLEGDAVKVATEALIEARAAVDEQD